MDRVERRASRAGLHLSLIAALLLALLAGLLGGPRPVKAAAFSTGNLVVLRVGTGSAALSNAATAVFLDEYSSGGTPIQSVGLPTAASGASAALTVSGTATSEGALSRSPDGRYLTLAGYEAAPGTAGVSTAGGLNRVVALVDANGALDTTTRINDGYTGNNIRGAVTNDGTGFWTSGTGTGGGTRYVALGSTGASTLLSSAPTNTRVPNIFGGQLYISSGASTFFGISAVGSGLPTSGGQTTTILPGFPTTSGPSPYGFALFDLDTGVAGLDTAYVSDDRATASGGGLQKWTFNGTTWTLAYTLNSGLTAGARGLAATLVGGTPVLYATTADTTSKLVTVTDTGASAAFTTLATAAANTVFRGVAFAPVAPQPDLSVGVSGPGSATVGTPYSYTVTVSNSGTAAASGVTASFTLPAGVTFGSASGTSGFSCAESGGLVTCAGGSLAAGASATLTVTVTPTSVGTVTLPAGAAQVDPGNTISESNEANNSSTAGVTTLVGSVANTAPTISVASGTPYLATPSFSGVVGDPSDPGATIGVQVTLGDAETPAADLVLSATSSNPAVVPNSPANLVLGGSGANRTLRIVPAGAGYATISLTVQDSGSLSAAATLTYAASAAAATPATSRFHTGASDASTAVELDAGFMLVANDEDQSLRLYSRQSSGLPLSAFDFSASLGLTDISGGNPREVDLEAAARSGSRVYWLGSLSNASGGNLRPNRNRLFATDLSGSGAGSTLSFVGYYDQLRGDLIAWDQSGAHGKGAGYYGLAASAAAGVIPEAPDGSGFNLEGAEFAPDNSTLYLAFRAPLAPAGARTKALIVPLTNPAALVGGSPAAGPASFGAPIELDLGGRGIRAIRKNAGNEYVIVAGPPDAATGTAPKDFRLYTWTGLPTDAPLLRAANLSALNTGGSFESIVGVPASLGSASQLQLLSDNGDTVWYGDGQISKDLSAPFQKFRSDLVTLGGPISPIRDLQGAAQVSPLVPTPLLDNATTYGPAVATQGIVTALASNGFYIQDPSPDADPATSEGIFVFTGSGGSKPNLADAVVVSGAVAEFRNGCTNAGCTSASSGWNNLTTTELSSNSGASVALSWSRLSAGNPLPAAVVIGAGGRVPPASVIEDDASGNVESPGVNTFDPAADGLDFYESLEGMRVQVNGAVVVGPTSSNGEIAVLPDNGAGFGPRTPRGGIITGENYTDFNPERVIIDDLLVASPPNAKVGDTLGTVVGVLDYSFGNFKLLNTAALSLADGGLSKEITALTGAGNKLTVADFNIENFTPQSGQRITDTANLIVTNLGAPDLVAVQEVQDNTGATDNGVVAADQTFAALIGAIGRVGGPTYQYVQIDPANNSDGGQGGGNIRQGFLYRTDRGLSFVARGSAGATTANSVVDAGGGVPQLQYSPGRIDPTNTAWSASRKPLAAEFNYNGKTIFVVNNHLNSKGGDQPLFGRFQPPVRSSEVQREQQAQLIHDFVAQILAIDPQAAVIVMGDLNDFHYSTVLSKLKQGVLTDLMEALLPASERYTYDFDGNSQSLDHILVSSSLAGLTEYDVVHVNAEFADALRTSDHDPSVARILIDPAVTPTPSSTPTSTSTPTNTPTNTPTSTPPTGTPATDTPTNTPTNTPTSTPPTGTPATDTPTSTPTNTPTNTPTSTPTGTPATSTPTGTPTSTPTATTTIVPTVTPVPGSRVYLPIATKL